MFDGEKTRIFWGGLFFAVISAVVLFHIFWYTLAVSTGLDLISLGPEIVGSTVFLLVGLYMMKNGTRKKADDKMRKNERPDGVIIVAGLTLFAGMVLGFFAAFAYALQGIGSNPEITLETASIGNGGSPVDYVLSLLPLFALALYAVCLSITMLISNSKHVWYASLIFWIAVCVVSFPFTYSIWTSNSNNPWFQHMAAWQMEQIEATLIPYIYATICLLYFLLSKNVKGYFGISS